MNGLLPNTTGDQFLEIAYRIPGVEHVTFKLDTDERGRGAHPSIEYDVRLTKRMSWRYRWVQSLARRKTLFSKLLLVWLLRFDFPVPDFYESNIRAPLRDFLPVNFRITINIK